MLPARFRNLIVALLAATPALEAQAPRGAAEAELGVAKVKLEYGCPPWNAQRLAQMDRMVPIGAVWRLGADARTTLVVEGGNVFVGNELVETGGYGLNLRRTGEKAWTFVIYDGTDTNVAIDDEACEVAAGLEEKKDAPPDRLVVSLADVKNRKTLVVRWGPLELTAPLAAVETKESDLAFGSEQAAARWFSRKSSEPPANGAWVRAGTMSSFYVGDVDCAMNVDLQLNAAANGGASARVRISNRERARVAGRIARCEHELSLLQSAAIKNTAQIQALEEAKAKWNEDLAGLASMPQPTELDVPLQAAKLPSGRIAAELVRRGGKLVVLVDAGDRSGEAAVDEARLLPAPAKAGDKKH